MAESGSGDKRADLIAAQHETENSIAWWTNIMILVSAGLLLLAFSPDSLVVSDNAETEMPFIGSASIQLVLISGPLVLLLIRMLLSSYLSHWNRLEREIRNLERTRELTLSIMKNRRLRRWAGVVHFPLVAIVFIAITAKGLAFPLWGELMSVLTIVVALWLTYRAARTGRWFNTGLMLAILTVMPLAFYYELMEPVPPQIDEGFARAQLRQDTDEDNYRGSLFRVGCSSPAVYGKAPDVNGCIGERKQTWQIEQKPVTEEDDLRDRIRRVVSYLNRFFVVQRRVDLSGADMPRADLRYLNLQFGSLTHANLSSSLLRYTRLQHATFTDARMRGTNFGRAIAWGAQFRRADLRQTQFWQSQFQGVNFTGADLEGARLLNSRFSGANMTRASLIDADLRSAVLDGANLDAARLKGARFGAVGQRRETSLKCTRLEGVDLSETTGLTQTMLDGACVDSGTKLPECKPDKPCLKLPEPKCPCRGGT